MLNTSRKTDINRSSDRYGHRQPRPEPRRQGTRRAVVHAAILEG